MNDQSLALSKIVFSSKAIVVSYLSKAKTTMETRSGRPQTGRSTSSMENQKRKKAKDVIVEDTLSGVQCITGETAG